MGEIKMERARAEQTKEKPPQSVEEAVEIFTSGGEESDAIEYLKAHPDDTVEFCQQTFEAYKQGDNTGIIKIGMIIEKLL